eukprot:5463941-Ditylum_brightwellii.AAC.1
MALQSAWMVIQDEVPCTEGEKEDKKEEESTTLFIAALSKCPCDLHVLWHKYKFGIGRQQPEKNLS